MDILSSVLIAAGLTITDPIVSTYPTASGAPFSVTSNVMNPNLNADRVDDKHASDLLSRSNHTGFQSIESITGLQVALDNGSGRWIAGQDAVEDLNTIEKSGLKTYGAPVSANRPTGYGTVLTVIGATSSGDANSNSFYNQLAFTTGFDVMYRGKIYTSGTYTPWYKLWTEKHFTQVQLNSMLASASRWNSTTEVADLGDGTQTPNIAWNAGVRIFGPSALNRPPVAYGSLVTHVGNTTTGDSEVGSWHTQLAFDTGGPFWYRTKLYNYGTPTAWKQVWTSGEFSSANITSWNNAVTAVAGKENAFTKGNIIAGTSNVSFSGTTVGRLVGSSDLIISVTGGGGTITGNGTSNNFALWNGSTSIGDSPLSYVGSTLVFNNTNFRVGLSNNFKVEYFTSLNVSGFSLSNSTGSSAYIFQRFNDEFSISRFGIDGSSGTTPLLTIGADRSLQLNPGSAAPITTNSQTLNTNFNSDMVDGYHAAFLLNRANHTGALTFTSAYVSDVNAIPGSGFYYGDNLTTNSPTQYAAFLEVNRAAGRRGQLAFDAYNDNGKMWVRTQGLGNSLSQWFEVMTTNTFGTSSTTTARGNDQRIINGQAAYDQLASKMSYDRTITINGNTQFVNNNPSFTLSGGSGIPTDRTITINGLTKNLNDSPVFTVSTGGAGGTVTQVGLTVPTGYYVTSSPITTSGNISFQWSAGYEPLQSSWINNWNQKLDNTLTITVNGGSYLLRNNPNLGSFLTPADMYGYVLASNTITINGNTQSLGGNPNFSFSSGGGGMPIDRTITINGNTQYINNNPNFTVSGGGGGGVSGSGNIRYLSMFTADGSNIGNSALRQIDFFTIWQISIETAGRTRTDLFVEGLIKPRGYTQSERDALTLKYPGSITYMTGANEGIYYLNNAGTWIKIG